MGDERAEQIAREVLRVMWIALAIVAGIVTTAYLARLGWDAGANGGGWS